MAAGHGRHRLKNPDPGPATRYIAEHQNNGITKAYETWEYYKIADQTNVDFIFHCYLIKLNETKIGKWSE